MGELVHVSQVERGLACDCVCPSCNERLIAKKGKYKEHHFAHVAGDPCQYAAETALHLAAKDILARRKEIILPAVQVKFYNRTDVITPENRYQLDSVKLEYRGEKDIVPDVLAYVGDSKLFIEVRVTHAVDDHKQKRIRDLDVSTLEIDLSDAPRDFLPEDLERLVVEAGDHKQWVYNATEAQRRKHVISEATIRPHIYRGLATHVDGCPVRARVWQGKPYANVIDDCTGCRYALDFVDESVICNGDHVSAQELHRLSQENPDLPHWVIPVPSQEPVDSIETKGVLKKLEENEAKEVLQNLEENEAEKYLKKLEEKVAQYWKDRLRDPKEVEQISNEHPLKRRAIAAYIQST
jgi:hypothetical protein